MIFDQVNVKVDRAVEHRHQVRELSDALDESGELYIKLKMYVCIYVLFMIFLFNADGKIRYKIK